MKKLAVLAALTIMSLSVFAQKAVVNNTTWDSMQPISFGTAGGAIPAGTTVYAQLLGGPAGGTLGPVYDNASGNSIFTVDPDGNYDAGVGVVPGMTAGGAADFELRAWTGGATFDAATQAGSVKFSGTANSWNDAAVPPAAPNGAALTIPSSVVITPVSTIPEPSTLALGLLGAAALLIRRRK